MLSVYFLPEAEAELYDAQDWYDSRSPGLGDRFFTAIDALLPRIGDNPQQFPVVFQNLRRAIVRRFPYAIYFRVEADGAYVVACAHTSRAPQSWQGRG